MNILRWGANVVEVSSPAGLIVAGAMLAVAFPPVRKTLRGAAVMATRGVLKAADAVKDSTAMIREGLKDMVAEARGPLAGGAAEPTRDGRRIIRGIRRHGRRLAITAAAGALAVHEGLHAIVAEARDSRESTRQLTAADAASVVLDGRCEPAGADGKSGPDGLEASEIDIGSEVPAKRTATRRRSRPSNNDEG